MILIDALTYAFRKNAILYPEQQAAIVYAIESVESQFKEEESDIALASFMQTLESLGFHRKTNIYQVFQEFLASPDHYRQRFPGFFCIPKATHSVPQLMTDTHVTFLIEPLLSLSMQKRFEQDFWDFKRNHLACFAAKDKTKATPQMHIGVYAHTLQDNASSLQRMKTHFSHLCNHPNNKIRQAYERFPLKLVMKILERSYP